MARFLNVSVDKVEDSFTKEDFLWREMMSKGLNQLTFEEIYNTAHLFKVPVRGCTTIATLLHTVAYREQDTDVASIQNVGRMLKEGIALQNVNPDTFTAKYVYNFIRTDKIFNSVLTHLLMSSAELPPFVYRLFGLFLPMKNDTTEHVKIVFQNDVFGSIVVTIGLR